LLRLDPGVHGTLLHTIDLDGSPTAVTVGEGSVWVAIEDGTVLKVDPLANEIDRRFQVGTDPEAIAYGEGSVWTANLGDDTVSRIDTATGEVTTIDVKVAPMGITAGEGAAWVSSGGFDVSGVARAQVTRIDPANDETGRSVTVASPCQPPLAVGEGAAWAATTAGAVQRLDSETGRAHEIVNVGAGLTGITVGAGSVWVAGDGQPSTLFRVSPEGKILDHISIGRTAPIPGRAECVPVSIAASPTTVWATNRDDATLSVVSATTDSVVSMVDISGGGVPKGGA